MAEDVVVALEAVEVVEDEGVRRAVLGVQRVLEVAHQPPPVAEAGERIGQRLAPRVGKHREVREERHPEAPDDGEQRRPRQRDREQVQAREVVGDQQRQAQQREQRRDDEHAPALERPRAHVAGRHPGGPGEQERRRRPARLEDRARLPGAGGVAPEVDPVADAEDDEAEGQRAPGATGLPAGERDAAGDHAEQDEVAERVGEVGRNLDRLAAGALQDALEDDGGGERGDGQGGKRAVDPEARVEAGDPGAQQHRDRDVDDRVVAEPQDVRDRRNRDRVEVPEDDRVVDVAQRPSHDADAHRQPGGALIADLDAARQAGEAGSDEHDVVAPLLEQPRERPGIEAGDGVEGAGGEQRPEGREDPAHRAPARQ